ncbi:MAG: hypothetical protein AVDCRST_MAG11-876, partial [uncultured Gemmatimonadaceae bacterium]
ERGSPVGGLVLVRRGARRRAPGRGPTGDRRRAA